jgi:hypothetical protein
VDRVTWTTWNPDQLIDRTVSVHLADKTLLSGVAVAAISDAFLLLKNLQTGRFTLAPWASVSHLEFS